MRISPTLLGAALLASSAAVFAQSAPTVAPVAPPAAPTSRWFDLQTATLSARYRFVDDSASHTVYNQVQDKELFRGMFKIDAEGDYGVVVQAGSGPSFTSSWNETGIGTGAPRTNLYVKQFYFTAKPVEGVELQYGGLGINRGVSTEITSYDNDGYVVGERATVRRPKALYFDEVSVTYGYLGDLAQPSVFDRFHRLNSSNYHQFLVSKSFGKRATVSADYTFAGGVETLRQAARFDVKESKVLDSARFEVYERTDVAKDAGFAVTVEKKIDRLTLGGGFADIDPNYGGLNGDFYNRGRRVFVTASEKLPAGFSLNAFYGRAVGNAFAVTNRDRCDVFVSYDLVPALHKLGHF